MKRTPGREASASAWIWGTSSTRLWMKGYSSTIGTPAASAVTVLLTSGLVTFGPSAVRWVPEGLSADVQANWVEPVGAVQCVARPEAQKWRGSQRVGRLWRLSQSWVAGRNCRVTAPRPKAGHRGQATPQ